MKTVIVTNTIKVKDEEFSKFIDNFQQTTNFPDSFFQSLIGHHKAEYKEKDFTCVSEVFDPHELN